MVCGSCHALHPAALTGLQFARSPDHFGGLADLLLPACLAADGFWQIVSGCRSAACCAPFKEHPEVNCKVGAGLQPGVFVFGALPFAETFRAQSRTQPRRGENSARLRAWCPRSNSSLCADSPPGSLGVRRSDFWTPVESIGLLKPELDLRFRAEAGTPLCFPAASRRAGRNRAGRTQIPR
jgi:hypothetical protein